MTGPIIEFLLFARKANRAGLRITQKHLAWKVETIVKESWSILTSFQGEMGAPVMCITFAEQFSRIDRKTERRCSLVRVVRERNQTAN